VRILDTDVCIEILRGNQQVIDRRANIIDEVATTWITACELSYGAEKSHYRDANAPLVTSFLATLPVVGLNLAAAEHFGRTKSQLESAGLRVADADLLIAAVAMAHGGTLVIGNRRHYDRITGLPLEDWIRGQGTSE